MHAADVSDILGTFLLYLIQGLNQLLKKKKQYKKTNELFEMQAHFFMELK